MAHAYKLGKQAISALLLFFLGMFAWGILSAIFTVGTVVAFGFAIPPIILRFIGLAIVLLVIVRWL